MREKILICSSCKVRSRDLLSEETPIIVEGDGHGIGILGGAVFGFLEKSLGEVKVLCGLGERILTFSEAVHAENIAN